MKYKIRIDKSALKFIARQTDRDKKRLLSSIYNLPGGDTTKLSGKHNMHRLRIGGYRVIYTINDNLFLIHVIEVGNRGDIYKS